MDNPNHNEAGLIAFALMNALLEALIAKGAITREEVAKVVSDAGESFLGDTRGSYAAAGNFLKVAALAKPVAK